MVLISVLIRWINKCSGVLAWDFARDRDIINREVWKTENLIGGWI